MGKNTHVKCIRKGDSYGITFELPKTETPIADAKVKLKKLLGKEPTNFEYEIVKN